MSNTEETMMPLPEFRELLGTSAEGLTDGQVARIREIQYTIADVLFDVLILNRKPSVPEKKKSGKI